MRRNTKILGAIGGFLCLILAATPVKAQGFLNYKDGTASTIIKDQWGNIDSNGNSLYLTGNKVYVDNAPYGKLGSEDKEIDFTVNGNVNSVATITANGNGIASKEVYLTANNCTYERVEFALSDCYKGHVNISNTDFYGFYARRIYDKSDVTINGCKSKIFSCEYEDIGTSNKAAQLDLYLKNINCKDDTAEYLGGGIYADGNVYGTVNLNLDSVKVRDVRLARMLFPNSSINFDAANSEFMYVSGANDSTENNVIDGTIDVKVHNTVVELLTHFTTESQKEYPNGKLEETSAREDNCQFNGPVNITIDQNSKVNQCYDCMDWTYDNMGKNVHVYLNNASGMRLISGNVHVSGDNEYEELSAGNLIFEKDGKLTNTETDVYYKVSGTGEFRIGNRDVRFNRNCIVDNNAMLTITPVELNNGKYVINRKSSDEHTKVSVYKYADITIWMKHFTSTVSPLYYYKSTLHDSLNGESDIAVITYDIDRIGSLKKGKSITSGNLKYKVNGYRTVTVVGPKSKNYKNMIIPEKIEKSGIDYEVTAVSDNAFKNNKKLKNITIGMNVTKLGKNAFYGCKNLRTITIKSKSLKSVGKNALKGIYKKATIKCPSPKKKAYKKLLTAKTGYKKTMKVK